MPKKRSKSNNTYSTNLGFEETLWAAADKLRGNMDASEYKGVVLGLIFLKYISDAFTIRYQQLELELNDPSSSSYVKEPSARYEEFRKISDSQSSRGSLTTKLLGQLPIVIPSKELINQFDLLVKPLVELIEKNLRQSNNLIEMRKVLLPRLINGELRIYEDN